MCRGRWKLCKSPWFWWLASEESIQITTFVNKANEAMITEETMTSKKSIADVMLKGVHKPEQEGVCKIIYS